MNKCLTHPRYGDTLIIKMLNKPIIHRGDCPSKGNCAAEITTIQTVSWLVHTNTCNCKTKNMV